ncbi:hypothetical protein [Spirosoma luteum]|uniref:hypothetical protein n=1 Tax=Spirosoma luteum TaxID=431553 RepID=UPI00036F7B31|nr:hypothetical protein [Spirosoma luteum]
MKQIILCCYLLAGSLLAGSLLAGAQDRATDEKQINEQIDAMIADWNRHNFDNITGAIAHLFWSVGAFYPPDGVDRGTNKMGDDHELATLVMIKQNGKWLLTAGHNIVIDEEAAKGNPVNYMPKN